MWFYGRLNFDHKNTFKNLWFAFGKIVARAAFIILTDDVQTGFGKMKL